MTETTDPEILVPRAVKASGNANVNPLLARARLPGDTFRLPSCGMFYTNGELAEDVEDGEVHVHPMAAIDEIVISSPSKLFSGDGVIEVIERCVPSILKPRELLAQDVDFLLLCLRKVSYGPTFDFEKVHEDCEAEREEGVAPRKQTFQANLGKLISQTKEIDPAKVAKMYRFELDNGQIVKMQPMRFSSYVKLMQILSQDTDEALSDTEQKDMMLDQLASMILSVDEIADQEMVREWLEVITPKQVRDVNKTISKMGTWGVDTKFTVTCRDCKKKMEVELPTNPLVLFS